MRHLSLLIVAAFVCMPALAVAQYGEMSPRAPMPSQDLIRQDPSLARFVPPGPGRAEAASPYAGNTELQTPPPAAPNPTAPMHTPPRDTGQPSIVPNPAAPALAQPAGVSNFASGAVYNTTTGSENAPTGGPLLSPSPDPLYTQPVSQRGADPASPRPESTVGESLYGHSPTAPPGELPLPRDSESKPIALKNREELGADNTNNNGTAGSLLTIGGSLAIVLSIFFIVAWGMRRAAPKSMFALPREVFEQLGRTPLDKGTTVRLVRLGRKLLLLSAGPEGMTTLAEVDDPLEVDYLIGLCQRANENSSSKSFQNILGNLTSLAGDREIRRDPTYDRGYEDRRERRSPPSIDEVDNTIEAERLQQLRATSRQPLPEGSYTADAYRAGTDRSIAGTTHSQRQEAGHG